MAHATEAHILEGYLTASTALPSIVSFQQFSALFAAKDQASRSSLIRELYHDLKLQRSLLQRKIAENVTAESSNARRLQMLTAEVKHRRREAPSESSISNGLPVAAHGFFRAKTVNQEDASSTSNLGQDGPQDLAGVMQLMQRGISFLQSDLARQEADNGLARAELESVIGNLSDLRYGRMGQPSLAEVVADIDRALIELLS